jgi:hypothetical protein
MASKPRGRSSIVEENEISPAEIREEKWRLSTIGEEVKSSEECMKWLARRRLLLNKIFSNCNMSCSLASYQQGVDGVRWMCNPCNKRTSIREGSFFARSHLQLSEILSSSTAGRTT